MAAPPLIVDLSHHNSTPDWDALKAGGIVGVIHKATEGTSYTDDELFKRASDAIAAGLTWATYHFMRPGNIDAQMQHYLDTVNPVEGERVVLDHEDAGVSLDDLVKAVKYIMVMRPDLEITIYSGHLIKDQLGDGYNDYLAKYTSLWIAQYTSAAAPSWPKGTWPQWSLWQYTDHADIPGCKGPVDANRFNGSAENCIKWMGPAGAIEPPAPPPDPDIEIPVVTVNIEAPDDVVVVVKVNGVDYGEARQEL